MGELGPKPTEIDVKLTWSEVFRASQVGLLRRVESMRSNRHTKGFSGMSWEPDIVGALGECAFAKGMNLYWDGSVNTFKKGGDVQGREVRTRTKLTDDMIVRDNDNDTSCFVLVVGACPNYRIVGWMKGEDAKREEWLGGGCYGPGAYFVPQKHLLDVSLLKGQDD